MSTVEISVKDCDFIANVIRDEIKELNINYHKAVDEGGKRAEQAKAMIKTLGFEDDEEIYQKYKELEALEKKCKENLDKTYSALSYKYMRCLEILMCGSTA